MIMSSTLIGLFTWWLLAAFHLLAVRAALAARAREFANLQKNNFYFCRLYEETVSNIRLGLKLYSPRDHQENTSYYQITSKLSRISKDYEKTQQD